MKRVMLELFAALKQIFEVAVMEEGEDHLLNEVRRKLSEFYFGGFEPLEVGGSIMQGYEGVDAQDDLVSAGEEFILFELLIKFVPVFFVHTLKQVVAFFQYLCLKHDILVLHCYLFASHCEFANYLVFLLLRIFLFYLFRLLPLQEDARPHLVSLS